MRDAVDTTLTSGSCLPTGREVLIVEDETRLREMLRSAITKMGFSVTLAASAEAAHKLVASKSFDILVLDLNLPGESGLEFLQRVRQQQSSATRKAASPRELRGMGSFAGEVQAIILTGFGDLAAARQAIHLDVVEFLTKPCALGELEAALGRAYERRRGQVMAGQGQPAVFDAEDAPRRMPAAAVTASSPTESASMEDLERQHILSVLEKHKGNRAATATELGISLRKLYYRLGEYQKRGLI
jgi:DNA-binding NtrC family response regulator